MDTRTTPPGRAWNYFKIMHVFRHPKFYDELRKKRKKFQKEQADKQASEQAIQETVPHNDIEEASRGAGGPTSRKQVSERASDQASDEDASKQR